MRTRMSVVKLMLNVFMVVIYQCHIYITKALYTNSDYGLNSAVIEILIEDAHGFKEQDQSTGICTDEYLHEYLHKYPQVLMDKFDGYCLEPEHECLEKRRLTLATGLTRIVQNV